MIDKTIDLARVGLSKSLMTNPCERKGAYSEFVRDAEGRRLAFPMPERVIFGKALDQAHGYIMWHESMGLAWTEADAVADGIRVANEADASETIDWLVFSLQLGNAVSLFRTQPDGLERLRAAGITGIQVSLRYEDIIGTPDYAIGGGVVDVKSTQRAYHPSKFYRSAEMGVYALLWSAANGGEVPKRLVYQVYVRKAKPEWQWLETPGTPELVALGRAHANRWRKGLAAKDPDLFAFDTTFCGDCGFRNPIPDIGFEGCPIGGLVPLDEEEAA